jgi:hypothetical protein
LIELWPRAEPSYLGWTGDFHGCGVRDVRVSWVGVDEEEVVEAGIAERRDKHLPVSLEMAAEEAG